MHIELMKLFVEFIISKRVEAILLHKLMISNAFPDLKMSTNEPTNEQSFFKMENEVAKKVGLIKIYNAIQVNPGEFEAERHYYPRVLNSTIHPLVASFFTLGNDRILTRYAHLVNLRQYRQI